MEKNVKDMRVVELITLIMNCTIEQAEELYQKYSHNIILLGNYLSFPNIKGIGKQKTLALQAAFEIGRRKAKKEEIERLNAQIINNSRTIFAQFNADLSDLNHEELWGIYLSKNGKILQRVRISEGGTDYTVGDIKKIVKPAIETMASNVVLCHNHPHSTTRPSPDDRVLTLKTKEALELFDIRLIDHVIISDGRYYSFADNGEL